MVVTILLCPQNNCLKTSVMFRVIHQTYTVPGDKAGIWSGPEDESLGLWLGTLP